MSQISMKLILKFSPPDALTTSTIAKRVSCLHHKPVVVVIVVVCEIVQSEFEK
jgi:hypothetical protein